MWSNRNLLVAMSIVTVTSEDFLAASAEREHMQTFDPALLCLGIYPTETCVRIHRKTHTTLECLQRRCS